MLMFWRPNSNIVFIQKKQQNVLRSMLGTEHFSNLQFSDLCFLLFMFLIGYSQYK